MRYFKKTATMFMATVVLFTGKTLLDLNAMGNEAEALNNHVEQIQTEQRGESKIATTATLITPEPTKVPEPEPVEPTARIYDIPLSKEPQEYTFTLCEENDLDYELILAIMEQESDYQERAISKTNDYGIMQINKANHRWLHEKLGIDNFLDAEQNIQAGIYMLTDLTHRYGNTHKVLMAYNTGEAGAKKLWEQGITTSEYSREIIARAEELRKEMKR